MTSKYSKEDVETHLKYLDNVKTKIPANLEECKKFWQNELKKINEHLKLTNNKEHGSKSEK